MDRGRGGQCGAMTGHRHRFAFDRPYRQVGRLFGVTPRSAWVDVDGDRLVAKFGPWTLETDRRNIRATDLSGPYSVLKTIGPAHLSAADRGLTFATNARFGVCLLFHEPVPGIDPFGLLEHPGLTVTIEDPHALIDQLAA